MAAAGRAGRRAPGHGAGGKAGPTPSWPRLTCQASFPRAGTTGLFQEHSLQVDFPRFPGLRWDPPPLLPCLGLGQPPAPSWAGVSRLLRRVSGRLRAADRRELGRATQSQTAVTSTMGSALR